MFRAIALCLLTLLLLVGCGGPPEPKSPFVRTEVKGLGDPEVVVVNAADRPITVRVTGPTNALLKIPKGETRSAKVKPGKYRYHAMAPAARPYDGADEFAPDGRYRWNFVIVSKLPKPPPTVVATLQQVLTSGFNQQVAFDGVRLGDPRGRLPGGFGADGAHPTGWKVLFKNGRASAFVFRSNFTSALELFEAKDLVSRFGDPSERMTEKESTIFVYDKLRVGFLVGDGQVVNGMMCL